MIRSRPLAIGFVVLLCSASAYPAILPLSADSFPLSTYPMFTSRRGQPLIHRAEAVLESGDSWIVPPELIGGGEALQTKAMLRRAVDRKGRALRELCRSIAERVSRARDDANQVEIVGVRFDPITYFTSGPKPVSREVYRACRVGAQPSGAPEEAD